MNALAVATFLASLFLSLISKATESDDGRAVHDERKWAAEVHVQGEIFYIPIVIDDTESPRLEPDVFHYIHRHKLPGAKLTPDLAALLRRYLEQYREHGEIRDA